MYCSHKTEWLTEEFFGKSRPLFAGPFELDDDVVVHHRDGMIIQGYLPAHENFLSGRGFKKYGIQFESG